MKKIILFLLICIIIGGCGFLGYYYSSNIKINTIPESYSTILEKYYLAITNNDSPEELIKNNINYMIDDINNPLINIGYTIIDLDEDGTNELVIGIKNLSDDFYNSLIFDLYTLKDNQSVNIFNSSERNRYYYIGTNKFINHASSSATETSNTLYEYKNGELIKLNENTDSVKKIELNLISLADFKSN